MAGAGRRRDAVFESVLIEAGMDAPQFGLGEIALDELHRRPGLYSGVSTGAGRRRSRTPDPAGRVREDSYLAAISAGSRTVKVLPSP